MAGEMKPQKTEPPGVMEEVEGQNKSSKKTEDLLAIVKKLLKEGSLAPQIEDQINRINELQQAKKKSGELGEAQALWETVHRELDSLNEEKLHLEEVLSKKQEALQILQLHCQRKRSETQRNHMSPENVEDMPIQNSQITDSLPQSAQGLHVGKQLEDLKGQQKDIWEFQQMLQHRLAWEIRALQGSQEQLLTEENQARAKLLELERQLCSPPEVETPQPDTKAAPADDESLKTQLEKLGGQVFTLTSSPPRDQEHLGEPDCGLPQNDPWLPGIGAEEEEEEEEDMQPRVH
ncbi:synaptonemal complex central element protein 1-like isoform X3 [Erinaceus europaeus]|uniref:Synaptonemal complex central element protein 1-like isoform X3 n=1 Tax=Erinaceus europaeus TaxID=9365 RepID=A0ABM3WX23_ERIEU|nr:synaptonemal complex central element protein 1-like isoform X3 [Erinaceus europaeus]